MSWGPRTEPPRSETEHMGVNSQVKSPVGLAYHSWTAIATAIPTNCKEGQYEHVNMNMSMIAS